MKTKTKIILIISCLCATVVNAQFDIFGPVAAPTGGFTAPSVQTIGIGDFPALADIKAKLHVDAFYLNTPLFSPINNGLLFRTDGENTFDCQWQMYTGATQATLTEKGRLFAPTANPTWFTLEASQPAGNLSFNTGGADERMIILGAASAATTGYVGIGTGFTLPNPCQLSYVLV